MERMVGLIRMMLRGFTFVEIAEAEELLKAETANTQQPTSAMKEGE